jgi:hypothetical protein
MIAVVRCTAKTPRSGDTSPAPMTDVAFQAVAGEPNKAWSTPLPYGHLVLAVDVPGVVVAFEVGREYTLELLPVPPPEPAQP